MKLLNQFNDLQDYNSQTKSYFLFLSFYLFRLPGRRHSIAVGQTLFGGCSKAPVSPVVTPRNTNRRKSIQVNIIPVWL